MPDAENRKPDGSEIVPSAGGETGKSEAPKPDPSASGTGPAPEISHLDLEADDADAGLPPPPETTAYDPRPAQDRVRGVLALSLVAILALTIFASFAYLWLVPEKSKDLHDLLTLIFGPVVALVGAATGYYFGSQSQK